MAGLACVCLLLSGQARALDASRRLTQLQVSSWDKKRGLPSNTVIGLAQTADGYLWIGTDAGLARFDGRRFTVYRRDRHPGLPSDNITAVAARGDHLWVGTSRGLTRLEGGAFIPVPGAPAARIYWLLEDSAGDLWLSTPTGTFRGSRGTFTPLLSPTGEPMAGARFVEAADRSVWLCAKGLFRWRNGTLENVGGARSFNRIHAAPDGSIWAVGRETLVHFQGGGETSFPVPPTVYFGLAADGDGSLWMTSGRGLTRRTRTGIEETIPPDTGLVGLAEEPLVDGEGDIWVGAQTGGLVRLRDPTVLSWSSAQGLPRGSIGGIAETDEGVLLGTTAGVAVVGPSGFRRLLPGTTAGPPAILADGDRLWLATARGLELRRGDEAHLTDPAIVFALMRAPDGLWAATSGGLHHYQDDHRVESYGARDGAPSDFFVSVARTADGAIWAGHRSGVCRVASRQLRCFGEAEHAPRGVVTSIHEDAAGDLWLGATDDGLYRVRGGAFTRFTTEDGLPSNTHYDLLEDGQGRLWTTSPTGISRIEKASLEPGKQARVRLYDERDGMRSADCMGIGMHALHARDGKFWFATTDGAAVVDPSTPDPVPPVLPTRIEETGQSQHGWLTVRYAAPTLAHGDELGFRHRLMGFDSDWVAGPEPFASYTNVPPGSYRFVAQARVGTGAWGPPAESVVTVPARWWQTAGFKLAGVLALGLLAFGGYRLRLSRLLAQQRRLESLVEVRTDELAQANATLERRVEAAVTSLRESERMAAYGTTVAGVAHEVRQPIFALGTTAYVLQQKLADRPDVTAELALVTRETRRVNLLMDELLDFARPAELQKAPIRPEAVLREAADLFRAEHDPAGSLRITVDSTASEPVALDEARIVQVLLNLMGNAQKHAQGITTIGLEARRQNGHLELAVENDGAPISPEHLPRLFEPFFRAGSSHGTGLGLAIVQRVVAMHGGVVHVSSSAEGTRFTLDLPVADG